MVGRKESRPDQCSGYDNIDSADAVVTGDITFSGNLDVEGGGRFHCIGRGQGVDAACYGRWLCRGLGQCPSMVNGSGEGDIHSAERLELASRAEVDGDVYYSLIEMAVGCKVNGNLRHVSAQVEDFAVEREKRLAEEQQ